MPTLPVFKDSGPYVRSKEDVPHEHALPDLWDDQDITDEEISEVLFEMVDSGELVIVWMEDRQEFGFCAPEEVPAKEAGRHRRRRVRKVSVPLRGAVLTLMAAVATPFAFAQASRVAQSHTAVELPDQETADVYVSPLMPTATPPAWPVSAAPWPDISTPTQRPEAKKGSDKKKVQGMSPAKHRRAVEVPEKSGAKPDYVGRHRKVMADPEPPRVPLQERRVGSVTVVPLSSLQRLPKASVSILAT